MSVNKKDPAPKPLEGNYRTSFQVPDPGHSNRE